MSTQATQTPAPAAQPPQFSKEAGDLFLSREVLAPYFFSKLASFGVEPQNEEEAIRLLNLGAKLENADRLAGTKKASSRLDFLKNAEEHLDGVLQEKFGMAPQSHSDMETDRLIDQDAATLAAHQTVRAALLAASGQ